MSKSVAAKEEQLPVQFDDMESMAGFGTEEAEATDFAIPFLSIAQGLSPQIEKGNAKYIAGLSTGEYFNTVTGEHWETVTVVPVKFEHKVLEFNVREAGGGLVAVYDDPAVGLARVVRDDDGREKRDELGRSRTADGTQIVDVRSIYAIHVKPDGSTTPVLISFKSTQTKKARQWLSQIREIKLPKKNGGFFNPPMFAYTYELSTATEKNAKGSWAGYVIARGELLDASSDLFQEAAEFYKSLSAGAVKVDYATMDGSEDEGDDAIPM